MIVPLLLWDAIQNLLPFPYRRIAAAGRAVVITGCDTGFGNGLARRLDSLGYRVFACCLTETGAEGLRLNCSSRLLAMKCDVTKPDDVDKLYVSLASVCPDGVHAVVNNGTMQP